jgi:hypothetical protein
MFSRREVAMFAWYGLLFSAIVLWASLRPAADPPSALRGTARVPAVAEPVTHFENLP